MLHHHNISLRLEKPIRVTLRNILFLIILITIHYSLITTVNAQWYKYKSLEVGTQPVSIFKDGNDNYNIFCLGRDVNFNRIYDPDSGDVQSSWWRFGSDFSTPYKVMDFNNGFLDYPFRPAVEGNSIYFHLGGIIKSYNLNTGTIIDNAVVDIDALAVSVWKNKLFLSIRLDVNGDMIVDSNFVIIYDIANKIILDTLPALSNVQQTLPFNANGKDYLAILNEGSFTENDSRIQIIDISNDNYDEVKIVNIGKAGNFLSFGNDVLIATANGSYQVHLISTDDFEIFNTINIEVGGWDGPREAIICIYYITTSIPNEISSQIAVSAYDGFVHLPESLIEPKKLKSDGKPEGIYSDIDLLIAANPFITDSYNPNDTVTIFKFEPVSVDNVVENESEIQIIPNPFSESAYIRLEHFSPSNKIYADLYSASGELINRYYLNINDKSSFYINAKELNLSSGMYYLKVSDGKFVITKPVCFISD